MSLENHQHSNVCEFIILIKQPMEVKLKKQVCNIYLTIYFTNKCIV